MLKPSASEFARNADTPKWIGTPYNVWDCQAFVEKMLCTVGVYKNWKGSNDMWRNAVDERKAIPDCVLLPGMLVFTLKNDGGEKQRGYNDDMGNAAHVGIYLGKCKVIHSTRGGVQWDSIDNPRWTHAAKCKFLQYDETVDNPMSDDLLNHLRKALTGAYNSWMEEHRNG